MNAVLQAVNTHKPPGHDVPRLLVDGLSFAYPPLPGHAAQAKATPKATSQATSKALSLSNTSPVLDGVSLALKAGELFGLLGPNGAGKTTFISLLAGMLKPAQGRICVAGHDLSTHVLAARAQTGLVFQSISLDRFMTVEENLRFAAGLQGMTADIIEERLLELARLLRLQDLLKRKVFTLSGGQQRLVDIARALMHSPLLLVLDEPTHGLDVLARQQVWSTLDGLRRLDNAVAILVSTHLMDEAADCDRVSFLQRGQLMWTGTPQEALMQLPPQTQAPVLPARSLAQWFVWRAGQ